MHWTLNEITEPPWAQNFSGYKVAHKNHFSSLVGVLSSMRQMPSQTPGAWLCTRNHPAVESSECRKTAEHGASTSEICCKTMLGTLHCFGLFPPVFQYPRQSLELPCPITGAKQMFYLLHEYWAVQWVIVLQEKAEGKATGQGRLLSKSWA